VISHDGLQFHQALAGMKLRLRDATESTADVNLYRQIIGSIMHAAVYTHTDIA
jgi:hypothetical protein